MGKQRPGALYVGDGRRFLDSQALSNIAQTHDVVQERDGWRVFAADGAMSCSCSLAQGRALLPDQSGSLYEVTSGRKMLPEMARTWLSHKMVKVYDVPPEWNQPKACGAACACGPCQHKHHDTPSSPEGSQ